MDSERMQVFEMFFRELMSRETMLTHKGAIEAVQQALAMLAEWDKARSPLTVGECMKTHTAGVADRSAKEAAERLYGVPPVGKGSECAAWYCDQCGSVNAGAVGLCSKCRRVKAALVTPPVAAVGKREPYSHRCDGCGSDISVGFWILREDGRHLCPKCAAPKPEVKGNSTVPAESVAPGWKDRGSVNKCPSCVGIASPVQGRDSPFACRSCGRVLSVGTC